jgi:hypothetical protein
MRRREHGRDRGGQTVLKEGVLMRFLTLLLVALLLLTCALAGAEPKVTVTSLVAREGIALTVYNPMVSLIQERRTISLNTGINEFRVSWAGVQVDRQSVRLELPEAGEEVIVRDAVLPRDDPNTVIWHLEAKQAGPQPVSISYYASGFSWSADYVMTVDADEKELTLKAWANVTNDSGENYQEAAIRLVMGDVRLISPRGASRLAGYATPSGAQPAAGTFTSAEEGLPFGREGFAEYTFYTLARPETLDSGDTKRIALAASATIPVRKVYTYDPKQLGENVAMQYWFENKKEYELGPMPPGLLRAYRQEDDGRLALLGEDMLSYVPLAETAKIYLGNARNILVETAQTDFRRIEEQWSPDKTRLISYIEEADYKITVKNRKADKIELILRQYLPGETKLVQSDPEPKQPRLGTLEWTLKIDAGKTQEITYRTSRKIYK